MNPNSSVIVIEVSHIVKFSKKAKVIANKCEVPSCEYENVPKQQIEVFIYQKKEMRSFKPEAHKESFSN